MVNPREGSAAGVRHEMNLGRQASTGASECFPARLRAGFGVIRLSPCADLGGGIELDGVDVDVLLRFLIGCREAVLPGRAGRNVYSIGDGRNTGYAPATINCRLAAVSALFAFGRCAIPRYATQCREAGRCAWRPAANAAACWAMWPSPRPLRDGFEPPRVPRPAAPQTRDEQVVRLHPHRPTPDRSLKTKIRASTHRVSQQDLAEVLWVRSCTAGRTTSDIPSPRTLSARWTASPGGE